MVGIKFFIMLVSALALTACASYQVSQDYDPEYEFVKLKTYHWISNPSLAAQAELVEKHIRKAVNMKLANKGFKLDGSDPDFFIAMHLGSEKKVELASWGYGYGPWNAGVDMYQYDEGTLAFDFIDGSTKELFFRGVIKAEIEHNIDFEQRQRRIENAVAKVLRHFPPEVRK